MAAFQKILNGTYKTGQATIHGALYEVKELYEHQTYCHSSHVVAIEINSGSGKHYGERRLKWQNISRQ